MVKKNIPVISEKFIADVSMRLAENKQVRRSLPEWGRIHIDRQLPFLCIYRKQNELDNSLSERLVMAEASYLIATANRKQHKQLSSLVKNVALTLKENFKSFIIVEVWISEDSETEKAYSAYKPAFKIIKPKKTQINSTVETLDKALRSIKIRREKSITEILESSKIAPPGLSPILSPAELKELGCHMIGIQVRPIFRNSERDQVFPIVRRDLQRGFSRALKNSFFEFTNKHTSLHPLHYQSLGRYRMVKAVWEVDRQLADICNGFDFLLQVTPNNSNAAWTEFQKNKFRKAPEFVYRPLPLDPALAKRRLFRVPIERIEDPTLGQLFREQQMELDRKFTMLIDRGTPRFLYGSLQLYGGIEKSLLELARDLLVHLPPRSRDELSRDYIDAKGFAIRASQELAHFRKIYPEIHSKVSVREDISGLMVSKGNLLIGSRLKVPSSRVEALIQHEVGTHVLTYINGKAQPLRQLYVGLADYDELQEGLAVLSEYMVDGLSRPRLRLLAARVIAAHHLISGDSFVEVFQVLNRTYGFDQYTSYYITMRTFRSGGLTKDAIYLRGLVRLLEYLKTGGALEPLFVGKISADHVGIIKELQLRKILNPAPLRPRYLDDPGIEKKISALRKGLNPLNLIKKQRK